MTSQAPKHAARQPVGVVILPDNVFKQLIAATNLVCTGSEAHAVLKTIPPALANANLSLSTACSVEIKARALLPMNTASTHCEAQQPFCFAFPADTCTFLLSADCLLFLLWTHLGGRRPCNRQPRIALVTKCALFQLTVPVAEGKALMPIPFLNGCGRVVSGIEASCK